MPQPRKHPICYCQTCGIRLTRTGKFCAEHWAAYSANGEMPDEAEREAVKQQIQSEWDAETEQRRGGGSRAWRVPVVRVESSEGE